MKKDVVFIDGRRFNVSIPEGGITRNFEIVDTDKAGRLINGEMQRDIIGTYYNYSIEFRTDNLSLDEYDSFYDIISAPEDYHTITVPYGQTTHTYKAYVTNGSDVLQKIDGHGNKWEGIKVNFIATAPARR